MKDSASASGIRRSGSAAELSNGPDTGPLEPLAVGARADQLAQIGDQLADVRAARAFDVEVRPTGRGFDPDEVQAAHGHAADRSLELLAPAGLLVEALARRP